MEKVILITSRKMGTRGPNFKEIEYGNILQDESGRQPVVSTNGYFRQFREWVKSDNEEFPTKKTGATDQDYKNECITFVQEIIRKNNPKKEGAFCVGIYKRKIENGPTIYVAEEYPGQGDEALMFSDNKQRYLNSIIMEINNDVNNQEIEWQIFSHDNDWGKKERAYCYKKKESKLSEDISTNPDFDDLKKVVDADSTEIWLFQHVDESDPVPDLAYLYVKDLFQEKKFREYKGWWQSTVFKKKLNGFYDYNEDVVLKGLHELENNLNPDDPFLP